MRDHRPWGEPVNIAIDHGSEDFDPEDAEREKRLPKVIARIERENPRRKRTGPLPVRFLKGLWDFICDLFLEGCRGGCLSMVVAIPVAITVLFYALS